VLIPLLRRRPSAASPRTTAGRSMRKLMTVGAVGYAGARRQVLLGLLRGFGCICCIPFRRLRDSADILLHVRRLRWDTAFCDLGRYGGYSWRRRLSSQSRRWLLRHGSERCVLVHLSRFRLRFAFGATSQFRKRFPRQNFETAVRSFVWTRFVR